MYNVKTNSKFTKGEFKVEIINPLLIDGQYNLSVWFGSSSENLFESKDVLSFEIENMCGIKPIKTSYIGSYRPEIKWNFN
jgi:hypothetical protein